MKSIFLFLILIHTPLLAVDIINYDYPHESGNYWHTLQDIPEKCSPASLAQVGKLLIHHIYDIE
mgnify:CR=1 FL=1|tara:strand:- start:140 stop:331 length:192 start_codon:yes stop_codon:yes gene_type:complete